MYNETAKWKKTYLYMVELFVSKLKSALSAPLPGTDAHVLLAPYRKNQVIPKSGARVSSVMILLYPIEEKVHFALTKRNEYQGTHSAQVSFPGGKMEPNDPTLFYTASRETEEETGVSVAEEKLLGELTQVYIPPSNFLVSPFVVWLENRPVFTLNPREVNYLIEFPLLDLLNENLIKETTVIAGNGIKMKVPYFDIKDEVVWGATAVILSELRSVIAKLH